MHIEGFKKFENIDITFNDKMNILVGENEAGKSTILEAIRLVINQMYKNSDKSILKDLFNRKQIRNFENNPSTETLPRILIEVEFNLETTHKNSEYFYGECYGKMKPQPEQYGIRFECKFDEDLGFGMEQSINEKRIPYEYYSLSWKTFSNRPYQIVNKPLNYLFIDTTNKDSSTAFNYFNRTLFNSRYDDETRLKAKNEFRLKLDEIFKLLKLPPISDNESFGIDSKKVILESVISVYENTIALENRGSGMESLIKTKIALEKKNKIDVVSIEEPENHLSPSTLQKMLEEIQSKEEEVQIILTTHNNLIASRLNLRNVLWIADEKSHSLYDIEKGIADFFVKADNNSFLELLLSKKVIMVEGATENLLMPKFYAQITESSIEKDEITIISCNGISYKNYLAIAEKANKRIAVITDNDKNQSKISEVKKYNEDHDNQHIFTSKDTNEYTWEKCIYDLNKEDLKKILNVRENAEYSYNGMNFEDDKVLGYMLNNKVKSAYIMLKSDKEFKVPNYVEDAIKWLNE